MTQKAQPRKPTSRAKKPVPKRRPSAARPGPSKTAAAQKAVAKKAVAKKAAPRPRARAAPTKPGIPDEVLAAATSPRKGSPRAAIIGIVSALVVAGLIIGVALSGSEPTTPKPVRPVATAEPGVRTGHAYGFSALFPTQPAKDTVEQDVQGMKVTITLLTAAPNNGDAYMVGFSDYPAAVDVSLPNLILQASAKGAASNTGGKLVKATPTKFGADPAIDFLISTPNGLHVKGRNLLHGRRIYTLLMTSESADPPGYSTFVESFKIL